jgi:hypothetical protein
MADSDRGAADTDAGGRGARGGGFRRYLRRLHLEVVVAQIVIIVVLAAIGWSLRPPSRGFHLIPDVGLQVILERPSKVAGFEETIVRSSDGASKLVLRADYTLQGHGGPRPWEFALYGIGQGHPCARQQRFGTSRVTGRELVDVPETASKQVVTVGGVGTAADVAICWPSSGPVALSGSYLTAVFPLIFGGHSALIDRTLYPNAGDLANYSVQSPTPPNAIHSAFWGWDLNTQSHDPLSVAAVNQSRNQTESYDTFVSGILFGVVGAGLIVLLSELLWPLSRRRDEAA